ncbi:MAG: hypothetical protein U0168_10645 [Nannocystaceae bacterium]
MAVLVVAMPVAVDPGAIDLRADVLPQRAAQRDVEQLDAATHAQHRHAAGPRDADQLALVGVAHRVAAPGVAQRRLAVAARGHVRAAGQHQAVDRVDHRAQTLLVLEIGQQQRHRAGVPQRQRHALLEVLQRLVPEHRPLGVGVEEVRRDAHAHARHHVASTTTSGIWISAADMPPWLPGMYTGSVPGGV